MSSEPLSKEELAQMERALRGVRKSISKLSDRFIKDAVKFKWREGDHEETVHFTKAWREFAHGVWGRSLDTTSERSAIVTYQAVRGHAGSEPA